VSDRTYGETKNCAGCRYWSEMIAKCDGGPVVAMCLAPNAKTKGQYWSARMSCDSWASGEFGAIDSPEFIYGHEENPYKAAKP
jgi:hypothetical protein